MHYSGIHIELGIRKIIRKSAEKMLEQAVTRGGVYHIIRGGGTWKENILK